MTNLIPCCNCGYPLDETESGMMTIADGKAMSSETVAILARCRELHTKNETLRKLVIVLNKTHAELYHEIEALRAKLPRWIPCIERLPDVNDPFLCVNKLGQMSVLWWWPEDDENYGWNGRIGVVDGITHWMPLPDAPRQEPTP